MGSDLTDRQLEVLEQLPATKAEIADVLDVQPTTVESHLESLEGKGYELDWTRDGSRYEWDVVDAPDDADQEADVEEEEEERETLTDRESYIYRSLPASVASLADELEISERAVEAHLDTIADKGWSLEGDDAGNWLALDQDHLRSSEHKTTRTRKANRWWQRSHDELVHEFQRLEWPRTSVSAFEGHEDWVTHMTDLHAGDIVRRDDGRPIYETPRIPDVIDYITRRSLALADKHGSTYDCGHLLWGGDFITNEGIYESQYEDLDAFLDEQHDTLVDPLIRQVKAFSERFPSLKVICQVGNHGQHRASGVSKQANADLVLYKTLRNTIAQIRKHTDGLLDNVEFVIGEAKPYRNFDMRDGAVRGHLRHGQDRVPQAVTRKGSDEWGRTARDHEFDVAYAGHHHISGRIPWDGPPVFFTGSPKPAGEFVERLRGRSPRRRQDMALCHGVSNDGVTGSFFIDSRDFDFLEG